ncbi:putative transcription factor WD40-like family [Dioscorea sansibarensis]
MAAPRSQEAWNCMLPGPSSRNNGGCADCSAGGLLAYGAGSSIVVADPRSMQLISVLPMPAPSQGSPSPLLVTSAHALAPFVTALRWIPQSISRDLSTQDEPCNSHLRLAVGDRQGRIAIWDFRSRLVVQWLDLDSGGAERSRLGIQDLCWILSDTWLLAAIHGPSLLALWNPTAARCIWKYDASPEFLSCIRRDPFDSRHLCVLGLRGFLLSAIVLSSGMEGDVSIKEHQISGVLDHAELQKLDKESSSASPNSPALAVFPLFCARFSFSPLWRHILLITFSKELVVFDLQYGASLSSTSLPRGMGKFMDVMPDPGMNQLYCAHLDGKLSTWKRKEGEQVHGLSKMGELMPAIGTAVPSPSVLAVILCQSESFLQKVGKLSVPSLSAHLSSAACYSLPSDLCAGTDLVSNSYLVSISDDGKIWSWLLASENSTDVQDTSSEMTKATDICEETVLQMQTEAKESEPVESANIHAVSSSPQGSNFFTKMSLIGQLQLLSSTVSTLAVPAPSLIATMARGGNVPAPAVSLVALGTQSGTIDVVDVSANAVAMSFSVHNSTVRGLRWLGNSRLVSFSYNQVNDKVGGFNNRLVVTCLRSGLNRPFRVLQKSERAPLRAIRASSSGRYLLIVFRDAPVEVWAMTKNPIMLRSLALPFTVLEWTLPSAPRPLQNGSSRQSPISSKEQSSNNISSGNASPTNLKTTPEGSGDDTSESFAFALVNGALGVFEVHGRRIRDFRPKWPSSSFVSSDGLVTAMAYRLPHVVMGDRLGNIRWWDVTTGLSSSFNTHKEGIRRIKFSPVVSGDCSRGRIAVLFYDNTFSIFDLDTSDPLANALLQPQSPGTLVLELDWLPMRTNKDEPLVLCIAGADSSFRLIEVNINGAKTSSGFNPRMFKERFRPIPLCLPILFPAAHASALRMVLQMGVKPAWFSSCNATTEVVTSHIPENGLASIGDLRSYMIKSDLPDVGDSVVPELLLKVLEPYRKEGCIFDDERARLYASVVNKGFAARLAFAAACFGEFSEALFWLQLPHAFLHFVDKSSSKSSKDASQSGFLSVAANISIPNIMPLAKNSMPERRMHYSMNNGQLKLMAFAQEELWGAATERIPWHERLEGEEAIQKRVHELISVGNLESAVSLLLSTPPEGSHFYPNALRAVALSSAVSRSLHELAVKVVAANMVRTDKTLSGIHLLCAVGKYQEACSQLQDAGCWTDAATLAATHLHGSDYARVLQRWADNVLHSEHNIWRALILYVAAGALHEALAALRNAQQPDSAAMFLLACHEINAHCVLKSQDSDKAVGEKLKFFLPGKSMGDEDLIAVSEYYGQYQRKLVHLCMDTPPLLY